MAAEFNLGKGKYKHRIAENQSAGRGVRKSLNGAKPVCHVLDEATIAGITKLSQKFGCNKSATIRMIVQKALEEAA